MKIAIVTALSLSFFAVGCGSKKAAMTTDSVTQGGGGGSKSKAKSERGGGVKTAAVNADFSPIFFELDSDEIAPQSRDKLETMASYLIGKKEAVTIEGHCDERGTTEYNLALGDRRARAIKDYLAHLGVASTQLKVISYGEERPAARGTNEDAWAQNRRGAFSRNN